MSTGPRKEMVKDINDYAKKLTLLKSVRGVDAKTIRKVFDSMVKFDAEATVRGRKSAMLVLRRQAVKRANVILKKKSQ